MLLYLLATFREKLKDSHLFTRQWARFKGKMTTFESSQAKFCDFELTMHR